MNKPEVNQKLTKRALIKVQYAFMNKICLKFYLLNYNVYQFVDLSRGPQDVGQRDVLDCGVCICIGCCPPSLYSDVLTGIYRRD